MNISAYVPFYNNKESVLAALQSLQEQSIPPIEVFALDDGSTDGGAELVEAHGFRCLRLGRNLGRGAARHRAMLEATGDLVVSCDATNVLPPDFIERLLPWFDDPNLVAAYGRIQDPNPKGVVSRWRARHLFKAEHKMYFNPRAPLITYGTLTCRLEILEVGNYDPTLLHSEDQELGDRLASAGFQIVFDPAVPVFCNVENSLIQVLERYWRWYAGIGEPLSINSYLRNTIYSVRYMAFQDIKSGDLLAAIISLLCPHIQFWNSAISLLR